MNNETITIYVGSSSYEVAARTFDKEYRDLWYVVNNFSFEEAQVLLSNLYNIVNPARPRRLSDAELVIKCALYKEDEKICVKEAEQCQMQPLSVALVGSVNSGGEQTTIR